MSSASVVGEHVLVQEGQRQPLLGRVAVELALPGRRDGRVDEHDDVLAGGQLRQLHGHPLGRN
jgi:hypothetical protein